MSRKKTLLVIEDGTEYTDAFVRLAPRAASEAEFLRAADADEARLLLAGRGIQGVFVDMVFDRTPPDRLCGSLEPLLSRFGGDRRRALAHLAENQGFFLLHELASAIPRGVPVVLAWDFTPEPARLALLRETIPTVEGMPEGASASTILETLLRG